VVLLVGGYNASRIAIQNERNLVLKNANAELDKKIAKIANLKEELEALKARQQAVEDLQGDRNQPVYLLDELVRQTPDGVYLKGLQAGRPEGGAERQRPVAGTGGRTAAQPVGQFALAGASGADRSARGATLAQGKSGRKVVEFTLSVRSSVRAR
jgi:type IV pilus assembly protein PilN